MPIYVVTLVEKNESIFKDLGTPGFFYKFEDAENSLISQGRILVETGREYAVIEEIRQGFCRFPSKSWWYRYNRSTKKFEFADRPEWTKSWGGFGIG